MSTFARITLGFHRNAHRKVPEGADGVSFSPATEEMFTVAQANAPSTRRAASRGKVCPLPRRLLKSSDKVDYMDIPLKPGPSRRAHSVPGAR
jgi:hypothetical protein